MMKIRNRFIAAAAPALAACAALGACSSPAAGSGAEAPAGGDTIVVGSYSAPADSALKVYRFDAATDSATLLYAMPVANASFAATGADDMLYAVDESDAASSSVTALRATASGAEPVSRQAVGGDSPCYIALSPDGRFAVTADYGDATVAVFPIAPDGALGPRRQLITLTGSGPVEGRQDTPHPHCIAFTPDGRFMLVNDLGSDRIHRFALAPAGADSLVAAEPDGAVELRPGSGPRHIVFNARGDMAYLINELSDMVTVLSYDGATLTPEQYIAADSVGAGGAADIHLSPDGRHLYASLRLKHDGIALFDVDPLSGRLAYRSHTPTGTHPRNFALSPDGTRMLVACRDADAVEVYHIDPESGALTLKGSIPQDKAVFVKYLNTER